MDGTLAPTLHKNKTVIQLPAAYPKDNNGLDTSMNMSKTKERISSEPEFHNHQEDQKNHAGMAKIKTRDSRWTTRTKRPVSRIHADYVWSTFTSASAL